MKTSVIAFATAIVAGIVLSAAGVRAPEAHPPLWMLTLHIFGYIIAFTSLAGFAVNLMLHDAIRDWDRRAQSPLQELPIITASDLFARAGGSKAFPAFAWVGFVLSVIALCIR